MPISKYNERHSDAVEFLTNSLQQANDKKCVVITHYLPSIELINEKYRGKNEQPYNQWFASSLDNLIEKHTAKVPLWIYGHTHDPSMTTLFQTEMVCNPHGYEGENKDPDLNFIIDL
jgi:Icc-related predicted phosphoesterase